VKTEFKLKYNNSALGFIWVLIKPLVIFMILFLVMSRVFPNGGSKFFPLYLLLGTIISGHFNEVTMSGINALLNKQALILKVNFPRYIVVISAMLLPFVNFLINLGIYLFIAITFFGKLPGIVSLAWFIFSYIMFFILMLGFSLYTSIWHVRLRDLGSIWELVLQLVFWLTPVFYDIELIKNKAQGTIGSLLLFAIQDMNPVSVFLQSAREAFIYDRVSNLDTVLVWFGIAVVFAYTGYLFFRKNVKKIAEDF